MTWTTETNRRIAGALGAAALSLALAGAAAGDDERGPITVEADTLEVEDEGAKVRAAGNVVVEWNTSKLTAAEIVVDQRERRVEATGEVGYESDEVRARASAARLDVDDETGRFDDIEMHLVDEVGRFGGASLEKAEGRHVLLDDGYFTTCETEEGHAPDWELRGKHLDVRFDDYARMRDARLEVRGVPVLYLPYFLFPTKQTRQSGLLAPSFGTSSNRGVLFSLPAYWAVDKHRDLTMTGVVETSARLGLDADYRYAPSRRRQGEIHVAYYNEDIRGEPKPGTPAVGVPENRGAVEFRHREFGGHWTGYADVQWIGDQRYLREVAPLDGTAADQDFRRTRRYTTSSVGLFGSKGFTSGGVDATTYQDLVGAVLDDGDDTTEDPVLRDTQQRPVFGWARSDGALGPAAFEVESSLGSFIREKGASGERLDVASTMALPLLADGPVQSRAWARGRASVYAMQERDVRDDQEAIVERLDTVPTRALFEGGIDVRSKLARDFHIGDSAKWSGMYHSIEPFAALRYANRSSWDDIPLFDRLDAIDGRDVVTWGIDQRFVMRRAPGSKDTAPFEIGRLTLSQSYKTSGAIVPGVIDGGLSDVDIAAFVRPWGGLALRSLLSVNGEASQVRGANASVSWETGPVPYLLRGRKSRIAGAYRYVRSDAGDDILQSTEALALLGVTRNVSLGLKALYDIVGQKWVEKAVGITFTSSCDCWSVGVGVMERVNPSTSYGLGDRGNPSELQVRIAFELLGLGGLGGNITDRTSPALDSVQYEDAGFWRGRW